MKNLLIILILTIGFYNSYSQSNNQITITEPRNGATVSQMKNTISLRFEPRIPAGRSIVVFIQDPNGNWWPYLNVSPQNGTPNYKVRNVQYGVPGDSGMSFSIQALIIDNSVRTNGINIGGETLFVCGGCEIPMPKYVGLRRLFSQYASPVVTVIRR